MGVRRASPREDRHCLRRIAAGDRDALAELYDRHAHALYGHALALTRRAEDAEDLVQTLFVRLAALGAELLGVGRPVPWLHRVLHHLALDLLRRRRRLVEEAAEPASRGTRIDGVEATALLARLPLEQREAVWLRLWGGMSFREIGRATAVSTFTAASRYRLALERLRREVGL